MNQKLNDAAVHAVTASGFPTEHGMCQKFVRLVVHSVYGEKFEPIIHQGTATEAAHAFQRDGHFIVPFDHSRPDKGSAEGDLLYKTTGSGGSGHVAIRVAGNKVAENSSAHIHNGDARGYRTLEEFDSDGKWDVIVRLPEPS